MRRIPTTLALTTIAVSILTGCTAPSASTVAAAPAKAAASPGAALASSVAVSRAPAFSVAQQNAIESAKSYVALSGFSREGLIDQLSSSSGDGYSQADATFAVDHIKVNWNQEAVESAKAYLKVGGFSRAGLIEQLSSASGDKYTLAQAKYAAAKVGL